MTGTIGPSAANAVRVINGNSCGSGSICGLFDGGSLVLTNAHVAGTRPGRDVVIRTQDNIDRPSRVIMAAYSDRTLTDWNIVHVSGFQGIRPVKLSKNRPTGSHYTKGSPRCVWPLTATDITTKDIDDDSPLWRWTPNAIGGQSGSGVWSDSNNLQYGLLTWSWGGYGAGQMTAEIYRQARNQTVAGAPRIDNLEELIGGERAETENGFYSLAISITELPIFAEDDQPSTPPTTPDEARLRAVEAIRKAKENLEAIANELMTDAERLGPNDGGNTSGGELFGLG